MWHADWRAIAAALARARAGWILAALVLVVADRALNAYRWIALLAPLPDRPPTSTLLRTFFISTFVGTFLPSTVGSDAVRAWSLSRDGVSRPQSVASVLLDRLLGVVSTLAAAAFGLALMPRIMDEPLVLWAVALVGTICAAAMLLIFSPRVDDLLRRGLAGWPATLRGSLGRLLDAVQAYRTERRILAFVLLASIAVQVLRVLQAWMLGRSLGIPIDPVPYFAFVPIIVLIMLLPVTINGFGTGQMAFVWTFQQVGVDAASAFALSVLFAGLGVIGNLPGGALYALGRPKPGNPSRV